MEIAVTFRVSGSSTVYITAVLKMCFTGEPKSQK